MKFKVNQFLFLPFLGIVSLISFPLQASNSVLPVQGYIVDSAGTPLSSDTAMVLNLYATCEDASPIAVFTQPSVSFSSGVYNTTLDLTTLTSAEQDSVNAATHLCLGIKVGTDAEMTPRSEYHAGLYSLHANTATTATTALTCSALSSSATTSLAGTGLTSTDGQLGLATSANITWSGSITNSGQLIVSQNPGGSTTDTSTGSASFLIAPESTQTGEMFLAVKDSSTDLFNVNKAGDIYAAGTVTLGSYTNSGSGCSSLTTSSAGVLTCGGGGGGGGSTALTADTGGATSGSAVTLAGGTNGIDTVTSGGNTITFNLDTTEIGSSTFGAGTDFNWTFNATGSQDPLLAFTTGLIGIKDSANTAAVGLAFYDNDSSNYVALKAPGTVSSNVTWTLPSADGSSGQILSTNGSGTLSWATLNDATIADALTISGGTINSTPIGQGTAAAGSFTTLSSSAAATLNSATVTNNETVGGTLGATGDFAVNTNKFMVTAASGNTTVAGTLGVTGASTLSSVSTSGAATLNSATVTNNETVGGTLGVTGATTLAGTTATTLSTSGAATLDSAAITNGATVGTTLGVSGQATFTRDPGGVGIPGTDPSSAAASVLISPVSSSTDEKFLAIKDGGTDLFTVDKEGDTVITGQTTLEAGTWAAPAIVFSDGHTGLFLSGPSQMGFSDGTGASTTMDGNGIGTVGLTVTGAVNLGRGTVAQITNISTAVTVNTASGVITTQAASTAAGASEIFTVNNTNVAAGSVVLLTISDYTTNGVPVVRLGSVNAGNFTVKIVNVHATDALNGTMKIHFAVL